MWENAQWSTCSAHWLTYLFCLFWSPQPFFLQSTAERSETDRGSRERGSPRDWQAEVDGPTYILLFAWRTRTPRRLLSSVCCFLCETFKNQQPRGKKDICLIQSTLKDFCAFSRLIWSIKGLWYYQQPFKWINERCWAPAVLYLFG